MQRPCPLLFFRGRFLRFFRLMMFEMLEQGLDTMFHIHESSSDMDLVQIREKVSYFLEEAHKAGLH